MFLYLSSSDRTISLSELFIMAARVGKDISKRHTSERIITRVSLEKIPRISERRKPIVKGSERRERLVKANAP